MTQNIKEAPLASHEGSLGNNFATGPMDFSPDLKFDDKFQKNILIADDDLHILNLLQRFLIKAGARVTACRNGKQALTFATNQLFDLVLLDLDMPVMCGMDTARKLRELKFKIPIIALTSKSQAEYKSQCHQAGFSLFLNKPIEASELIESLRNVAQLSEKAHDTKAENVSAPLHFDEATIQVLPIFQNQLRTSCHEMEIHLKRCRWRQIANIAHKIKGSARGYGFAEIAGVAREIEKEAKQFPRASSLKPLIKKFRLDIMKVNETLQKVL